MFFCNIEGNVMKKTTKTIVLLFMVSILMLLVPLAVASTTTYEDTFEDDTIDANPSESWYSYTETGWVYANATDIAGYNSDQSYLINDENGTGNGTIFDVADRDYDIFELDFKINTTNHSEVWVNIYGANSGVFPVCCWNISDTDCTFYVETTECGFDLAEIWTVAISNNTWYRIRAEFNYNTHKITGELWEEIYGVQGIPHQLEEGTAETCHNFEEVDTVTMIGTSDVDVYIFFDDLTLVDYTGTTETTNYLIDIVIPILVVVAGLLTVMGLLFTVGVTKESFIAVMIIIVVMIAFLQAIMGV